jgi:hypothetical protein
MSDPDEKSEGVRQRQILRLICQIRIHRSCHEVLTDRGLGDQEVVLLMGNCLSQITGDVMDLHAAVSVRVVILAPHITQILQLLDLTLFTIFKREGKYRLPFDELTTTINFVSHVYNHSQKTRN